MKESCTIILSIITSYTTPLAKHNSQTHNVTPYISRLAKDLIALQTVLLMIDFEFGLEKHSSFSMDIHMIITQGKKINEFNLSICKEHNEEFFLLSKKPDLKLKYTVNIALR